VKSPGSAHTGTGAWLVQRATALILALSLPLLTGRAVLAWPFDHAGWQALFEPAWVRVALLFTAFALALHAWVGMRDILMDYVKPIALRLALYLWVITTLAGNVLWLASILWRPA
jgi:succinate dehydrogenase / fumarate reductase membrane anchor subunit